VQNGIVVGYIPQNDKDLLPDEMRVTDWLANFQTRDIKTRLGAMNFGREEMDLRLGQLSSGQRMKVMFLSLVAQVPDILLLDEPMSNLSLFSRQELRQAVKEFAGPAIIVTHDRKFIQDVADRIYQISNDKLVEISQADFCDEN
jgi:ATP-binding cassette subfamily F protein 3